MCIYHKYVLDIIIKLIEIYCNNSLLDYKTLFNRGEVGTYTPFYNVIWDVNIISDPLYYAVCFVVKHAA